MTKTQVLRAMYDHRELHLHAQAAGPKGAKRWVLVLHPHLGMCDRTPRCLRIPLKLEA